MRAAYESIKEDVENRDAVIEEYEHIRKTVMAYRSQSRETRQQAGELLHIGEKAYRLRENGDAFFNVWQLLVLMKHYHIPAEELFQVKSHQTAAVGKSAKATEMTVIPDGKASRHCE